MITMFWGLVVVLLVNKVFSEKQLCKESKEILTLDKKLCLMLTNPTFQDGLTMLSDLLNLHLLMNEVAWKFQDQKEEAWTIVDNLEDAGGLSILNSPLNGTRIQQALVWPHDKLSDIKDSLKGISVLWRDLTKSAREPMINANHPKDINFQLDPIKK